jgi:hypothetical protein
MLLKLSERMFKAKECFKKRGGEEKKKEEEKCSVVPFSLV